MMRADHLIHGEIAEPQPPPGFLLARFGWAAEPVAAMMHADRSLFADLFAIDRSRMHLIGLQWRISICQRRQKSVHCWCAPRRAKS
jgi:hypothetical protein